MRGPPTSGGVRGTRKCTEPGLEGLPQRVTLAAPELRGCLGPAGLSVHQETKWPAGLRREARKMKLPGKQGHVACSELPFGDRGF